MAEETVSRLASQSRVVGYYAGIIFGVGYCLTLIGFIALFAEIMVRSNVFRYATQIPAWFIAALIFLFVGVICGVYFGVTLVRNSRAMRGSGVNINLLSSSVNAFSFMLLFVGVGFTVLAAGLKASLFTPICGIVGAILLFIGFRIYRSEASESKLIGAIMLLVSIVLTYFVAFKDLIKYVGAGPLFSEPTLEFAALLIAVICGIIFAFPTLKEELKRAIAGIILSVSAILFSCGLMYFNFSAVSAIENLRYLGRTFYGAYPGWPGYTTITLDSVWVIFFGFLLLGISGILILVAACLPLAISAKQLSTQARALKPETGAPSLGIKYCPKCAASMSADAVFCPKCGQKQTSS